MRKHVGYWFALGAIYFLYGCERVLDYVDAVRDEWEKR